MSLQFQQLYCLESSPKDIFEQINEQNNHKLEIAEYIDSENILLMEKEKLYQKLQTESSYIYKQFGVSVLQLHNRNQELSIDNFNLQELSKKCLGLIILMDHYEGYFTYFEAMENGKVIALIKSLPDSDVNAIESDDERFTQLIKQLEETADNNMKRLEGGLVFAYSPDKLFSTVGLDFSKLYNPRVDAIEEILFIVEK